MGRNFKLERLQRGETFVTSEKGNSMVPLISSGQEHILEPATWETVEVGDIAYCKVKGNWYTHLVTAKNDSRGCQISNNSGYVNGWTKAVYGVVTEVIGGKYKRKKKENMGKLNVKTRKVIDSFDFDRLVQETYGRPYCFQQQDDCKPRGVHHFTVPEEYTCDGEMNDKIPEKINGDVMGVKFKVWLERDPKEWNGKKGDENHLDLFWERNFYPDFGTLVNDLHKRGLIEEGEYTLEIDW